MKQPNPTLTVLVLALLLAAFPTVAQDRFLPDLIPSLDENRPQPLWVSAEAGLVDGKIVASLFSDFELSELENLVSLAHSARQRNLKEGRSVAEGTCSIVTSPSGGGDPIPFREAARVYPFVLSGRIEAAGKGFYHGLPRTLYRVSVDQVLKTPVGTDAPTEFYAIYPQANLLIDGELICERSYRPSTLQPVVGQRVVVFGSRLEETEVLLLTVSVDGWLFETAQGEVFLPGQNVDTILDPADWAWVEGLLGSLFAEQGGDP